MFYLFDRIYSLAENIGGLAHVPFNEIGEMEGVPHVWTTGANPKIIIFTDLIEDSEEHQTMSTVTFDAHSHEYLTAKEFVKIYPDCTSIEFRSLNSLVEIKE